MQSADDDSSSFDVVPLRPLTAWTFFAASIASFGFYLPFWAHRVARAFPSDGEDGRNAKWWALGVLIPPVAVFVLWQFASDVASLRGARGGRIWLPPALLALISVADILLPTHPLLLPTVLVFPLSFWLVQREINQAAGDPSAEPARFAPLETGWKRRAALAPALCAALGAGLWVDWDAARDLSRPDLEIGDQIVGASGRYHLTVRSEGWRTVEAGRIGDPDSDLEVLGPGDAWLIVYTTPGETIDGTVHWRREVLTQNEPQWKVVEHRDFVPGTLHPRSTMRYDGFVPGTGPTAYRVVTVELEDQLVEAIGYSTDEADFESLGGMVGSLTLADDAGAETP